MIEAFDLADGLVLDLIEEIQKVGAIPVVHLRSNAAIRAQLMHATEASMKLQGELELAQMKQVQAYIGIRASANVSELADVPPAHMALYQKHVKTVEQVGGISNDEFASLNKALHRLERFWTYQILYRL